MCLVLELSNLTRASCSCTHHSEPFLELEQMASVQQAFGRAALAAGGTMLALGGATMVVSTLGMTVARVVVERHKVCRGASPPPTTTAS